MKRIVRLTESDLVRLVKQVVKEAVTIDPYKLEAKNGNLKITNISSNTSYTYKLEKDSWPVDLDLNVISIDGTGLTVKALGQTVKTELNKEKIKNLIKTNWGKSSLSYEAPSGDTIIFTKV